MRKQREKIQKCTANLGVQTYLDYRLFLEDLYQAILQQLDKYSYLQFAEDLGFPRTSGIRAILRGERPLTEKAAAKIARNTGLIGNDRRYWTKLVKYNHARNLLERDRLFKSLVSCRLRANTDLPNTLIEAYFAEWYIPVIRELLAAGAVKSDPEIIQQKLAFPVRLDQIKRALEILNELGLFQQNTQAKQQIVSPTEVDSLGAIRYHQQMLDLAKEAMTRIDEHNRDIRAVTVRLPEAAIPYLKDKLYRFALEVLEMEEHFAQGDEVIQLNLQMFPFTKIDKGEKR